MGKILTVCNQKGGTSKSSSAVNLGAALKMKGKKVLIVDLDPQGDASTYLGYEEEFSDTISQMMERFVRGESTLIFTILFRSAKRMTVWSIFLRTFRLQVRRCILCL